MGNYQYIFHKRDIIEAQLARKIYISSNLENIRKESETEYQSQKRFLKNNYNYIKTSDSSEIIKYSDRCMQSEAFTAFLIREDMDTYYDQRKELENGNSPLVKYLVSPFVIEHNKQEIIDLKQNNYLKIQNINVVRDTLATTKFNKNWLQQKIPLFRFKENKFIKEQNNIIKNNLLDMRHNDAKIKLSEAHIDREIDFQQKFELKNHAKLEKLKNQYNIFVRKSINAEAHPEAVEQLTNKPYSYGPLFSYSNRNNDSNFIDPSKTSSEAPTPIAAQPAPAPQPQIIPNN